MKRNRLPLNALRAFEAAGRHQSFKEAADELSVSDAAISRQVRDLEVLIGARLFDREHRRVQLTEVGGRLLASISQNFDAIDAALSRLMAPPASSVVSLSVEPTFATLFLVPRLNDFAERYPDIEVQFDSSATLVDVSVGGPRLAIRHSLRIKSWPRSQSQHLMSNMVTPMTGPGAGSVRLHQPADLVGVRLLRDENDEAWVRWLESAGVADPPLWGPVFSNGAIALQGAEGGQGAALGNRVLAAQLLAKGSLHAPFDVELSNGAYWLVAPDFRDLSSAETVFCQWLRSKLDQAVQA
jgi:LysR family glycine cleavage system transcriptional activator